MYGGRAITWKIDITLNITEKHEVDYIVDLGFGVIEDDKFIELGGPQMTGVGGNIAVSETLADINKKINFYAGKNNYDVYQLNININSGNNHINNKTANITLQAAKNIIISQELEINATIAMLPKSQSWCSIL
jgi:hypothetical protein